MSKTILFIHGLFMNSKSWKGWKTFFEAQGYTCYAPDYPLHEGSPNDLRKDIPTNLGTVTLEAVVTHYEKHINNMPEKPIVIGHSMGGLVVQKLVEKGKVAAAVCIGSAPPLGIITMQWRFYKSNLPVLNYLKGNSVFQPTKSWFHYAFCNTMPRTESDDVYEKLVLPDSRNIPRATMSWYAKINFKKPHPPLLFIAGNKDNIVPSILSKRNFKAYKDKNSIRDFKEFKERSHFICGQKNWEEVSEYILNWLTVL